jgi:hypothetical protein
MKPICITLFMLMFFQFAYSQQDTIFTTGEKIICTVKEVTVDAVSFTYPEEDIVNTIYKNTVDKIVFRSGRVQRFAEATSFKTVNGPEDFENVSITMVENEVNGLFKLANVSSKAKGTTTFSNIERVKERAYRKMKMEAAMQGANIVYIIQQQTQGNQYGTQYQAGNTTETNIDGIAYSNKIPKFVDFNALIAGKTQFRVMTRLKLWSGASDMTTDPLDGILIINSVIDEGGLIMIYGSIGKVKAEKFRVVSFNNTRFVLVYEDKSTIYNLVFMI